MSWAIYQVKFAGLCSGQVDCMQLGSSRAYVYSLAIGVGESLTTTVGTSCIGQLNAPPFNCCMPSGPCMLFVEES